MTTLETLRRELATSLLCLAELHRRTERPASRETGLSRAVDELQHSLSELEAALEELREQGTRLEAARFEAEQERARSQALFELAPVPYLLTDERGTIKNANDAAAAILSIGRRFLAGKPITHFVDGRRAEFLRAVAGAVNSSEPVTIDFTLRPRERAPHPARVTLRRFTLPDGDTGLWWILALSAPNQ